jgi:hypothetical protein
LPSGGRTVGGAPATEAREGNRRADQDARPGAPAQPSVRTASRSNVPPKYDVAIVEAVILEVAAELHPQHLTAADLALRIASDTEDSGEVETAAEAIRNLREFGLFHPRDDGIVALTPAALRACALLT